jgi:hypothetical protein
MPAYTTKIGLSSCGVPKNKKTPNTEKTTIAMRPSKKMHDANVFTKINSIGILPFSLSMISVFVCKNITTLLTTTAMTMENSTCGVSHANHPVLSVNKRSKITASTKNRLKHSVLIVLSRTSGRPLYFSLFLSLENGLGSTDYLRLNWNEQIYTTAKT